LARDYLEKMARHQRPYFFFPYAVDVSWFEKQSAIYRARRDEIRRSFGIGADDFSVLGIMKWHPREDPVTLLRAFRGFHKKHPHSRLLLIGDGPLRPEIERFSVEVGKAVIMPGYQPYSKLPQFYAISDVFVHPSVNEPWGVSVQEALACGLPVMVAEGVGSRFDLLDEETTGWTFANGDTEALENRLAKLADNADLVSHMGAAAREHAHRLDYDFTQHQFRAAIEKLGH
jgi:glycosyltransferase involved in cell wall biosynthesis